MSVIGIEHSGDRRFRRRRIRATISAPRLETMKARPDFTQLRLSRVSFSKAIQLSYSTNGETKRNSML